MRRVVILSLAVLMASVPLASTTLRVWTEPLTAIRFAPKPVDRTTDHRALRQPTVPSTCEEIPFVEAAAKPGLTPAERERGYLLFHRPITEPVYPNSKPRAHERLEQLVAFATPGEFELLTFSIYPVRKLRNLKVRCSPLTCDADGSIIILNTSTLVPGRYRLDLTIVDADGMKCAHEAQSIEAVEGPLGAESVREK